MNRIALLALPLALAAGVTPAFSAQHLPEGPARLGQTVHVGGPTVRPLKIVSDSRCPADVNCVWAGTVILRAEIGTGRGKRQMDLTLGTPVHVADGTLTLTRVTPDKRIHGKAIKPGDYRLTFAFAGGL